MSIQTALVTAGDLERMPQHDKHVELVRGEIVEMSPAKTITVYRSLKNVRVLTIQDMLDGDDVLPGFAVGLTEIFE